jgi:hypothetical protein
MKLRSVCTIALLLFVGCDDADSGTDAGGADAATADAATVGDSGTGGEDAGTSGPVVRSHPCPGINRTDAFWVDEDGTMWLGCGSGTEGDGLFVSSDDGQSWAIPDTSPANVLNSFRVLSIHRGFDDLVYVAGEGPNDAMVISLDTSATPFAAEAVLTRGTTVGRSFLASPFLTTPSGAALADSFTGNDLLYRPTSDIGDDANDWVDAGDWETEGSYQLLDAVNVGETFVGCGSTIAQPPIVALSTAATDDEPWRMTPVVLVEGLGSYTGEMWGVAADETRVVAVGVDQDNDIGKIFVSGADRFDAADYTQIDVDPLVAAVDGSDSTWSRGVCLQGDRVVVVGEVQPLGAGDNTGFVLESTDGGVTFTDITPAGSPNTWSKCRITGSGDLRVAGAGAVAVF